MAESGDTNASQTLNGHAGGVGIPKITTGQWLLHLGLLLATFVTTTICGIVMSLPAASPDAGADSGGFAGSLWLIPWYYVTAVVDLIRYAFAHPSILKDGLIYSGSLLAILASHESGHYFACRYYGVEATLPFFIPQPPLIIPLPGTFGAFIKIKSPVPSRRALFDIGLAGPLAGFIVMVPVAFAGLLTLEHQVVPPGAAGVTFNDPPLFRLIGWTFGIRLDDGVVNPFYLAAWIGALVTALNLMPVGQLDGGHGTYSVFGGRAHWWIGRAALVIMAVIAVLGWSWHGSPGGFLFVVLLAVMLFVGHPQPQRMEPLDTARIIVGIITGIVFALCFWPFPITFT
jgi:membrane-associated protease RseP (regulator of RpoE activity)